MEKPVTVDLCSLSLVTLCDRCIDVLKNLLLKRVGVEALSVVLTSDVRCAEEEEMVGNPMFPVCLELTSVEAEICPGVDGEL